MYTKCENDCVSEKIRMPKIIEYKDGSRQMLVANIILVANMPMTCRFLLFFLFHVITFVTKKYAYVTLNER